MLDRIREANEEAKARLREERDAQELEEMVCTVRFVCLVQCRALFQPPLINIGMAGHSASRWYVSSLCKVLLARQQVPS